MDTVNADFDTNIQIDRLDLSLLFWDASLKEVFIEDHHKDTLIYVNRLTTSISSIRDLANGDLLFKDISLEGLTFNLTTYEGETDTNLDVFVDKLDDGQPRKPGESPFLLKSDGVFISEGRFRLIDYNLETPVVLDFTELEGETQNLEIIGPDVNILVDKLAFMTEQGVVVEKLTADFHYTKSQMRFEDFGLSTGKSDLSGEIIFTYDRKDLVEFFDKVQLVGHFQDSKVSLDDINAFYNEFGQGKEVLVNSQLSGTLNELRCTKLFMQTGRTGGRGDFTFHNLFSKDAPFFMDADVRAITTSYYQLRGLMPRVLGNSLPTALEKFGTFRVSGPAKVSETEVNAQLNVRSAIGHGYSDLQITDYDNAKNADYKGFVSLIDFDFGAFLDNESLGKATMDINVEGEGFERETLNTEVIGKIYSFGFNGYDYKEVNVSGILKEQLFDGRLTSNDPNFKFDFSGLADFTAERNDFNFRANVDYANLYALNFNKDTVSEFKGVIDMDVTGRTLDNMVGTLSFEKTSYKNPNDTYYFEDFQVSSTFESDTLRVIDINSPDIFNGYIKGNFRVRELGQMVQNSIGSIYTNYQPYEIRPGQFVDFNLKVNSKILGVFFPKVKFGTETELRGAIKADEGDVKLNFKSSKVYYMGNHLENIDVRIDNKQPLFNTFVGVGKIDNEYYDLKDFELINTTLNDTLFFRTEFKGGDKAKDKFNLNFYHTFEANNRSVIGLKKSDIQFKGNTWVLNKEGNKKNKVIFNSALDSVIIEEVVMNNNQKEEIQLRGKMADTTYKDIQLKFKIVTLDKITPDIEGVKLDGVVDGSLNILQKEGVYLPSTNLFIGDFGINDYPMGDFSIGLVGNKDLSDFVVNAQLEQQGRDKFSLFGNIENRTEMPQANLLMNFDDFDVAPFNPLVSHIFEDMRGLVQGNARITGDLADPDINGVLSLNNAGLGIPYLNVDYDFGAYSKISLMDKSFNFDNIRLRDRAYSTTGYLNGSITHDGFGDWNFDLGIDTRGGRLLVLNTEFDEEELYYGSAFLQGTGRISGPPNNLKINVEGNTARGTSLKIPLSDVESVGDYSFINFIDKNEVIALESSRQLDEYDNLEMVFDLNVTPEAEVEIVVDQENKSTLKGRGEGILLLEIDTQGKFNMYGSYVVVEGSYRHRIGAVVDKTFSVKPGGTINWERDPLAANLLLEAVYSLTANPAPLLDNSSYSRRIDTDVVIRLTGELEQPEIAFDIEFPGAGSIIESELLFRLQDPTVRERNAIFLMAQGSFVDEQSGFNQQAVTGNLIQSASGMLNQMLDNDSDNFSFGLTYEQGYVNRNSDRPQEDRLGVNVSTKISDKVLFNGKFGVPVGGVTETVVAGDAEVEVLLNEDGTLRAQIFNREDETLQFIGQQQGYVQGVGVSYEVDFNTFKELMRKILGKEEDPAQEKSALPQESPQIMGKDSLIRISTKKKTLNN
ncbi:DUF490 domain-containing protein [Sediminicola luteus]|uniref:DUF490 domain-containing protein n=2 Tax=Sediminicola luteus TaxID=319238 RepID=A0A2A4G2P1_9FLAO|nr:DUF490 domain-containing protein [Sediminicola luteus]